MKRIQDKQDFLLQALLLLAFGVLYGFWASHMSVNIAPDEYMRFLVPKYIVEHGCLPIGSDPEIINTIWGSSYAFEVYGSSLLAAIPMAFVAMVTTDISSWILAARFTNVLLSVATLFFCLKIGKRLFKTKSLKYLFTCMVGLWPQYVFLSSYFNSDIIGLCATACTILALVKGIQERWSWKNCILLGLSLGFCALSYYYAYGIIVVSIIAYFASQYSLRKSLRLSHGAQREHAVSAYLIKPLAIFVVAFALAGWFFIRNVVIYGDFFGLQASEACSELYASPEYKPSNHATPYKDGYTFADMLTKKYLNTYWVLLSAQTFTGVFGYFQYHIPHILIYTYLAFLCIGALCGLIHIIRNKNNEYRYRALLIICAALTIIIPIGLSFYYSWTSDWQPQGRYFIYALLPLAILATYGYGFAHQGKGTTVFQDASLRGRLISWLPYAVIVLWIAFFIIACATTIVPSCLSTQIYP